jgi:hypothetical protein
MSTDRPTSTSSTTPHATAPTRTIAAPPHRGTRVAVEFLGR